jgi:hypothetical protein
MHGPSPVRIGRVNDDRTKWKMAGEQLGHLKTSSWIAGCTGLWIQIVIERNQVSVGKIVFALCNHRWRIAPDLHLPICSKLAGSVLESRYSRSVVLEKKQRFHFYRMTLIPHRLYRQRGQRHVLVRLAEIARRPVVGEQDDGVLSHVVGHARAGGQRERVEFVLLHVGW